MERIEIFSNLGVALALGLLIGLERGWKQREDAEGARFAGIRTFAITCVLGGVAAVLGRTAGVWVLAAAIPSFVLLLIGGMLRPVMKDDDHSVTTFIALMITLLIGVLAGYGYLASAAATAVVVTLLLGIKAPLHAWVRRLEWDEISAFLKLLLISVVVLPLLPNAGYGPWQALNPYQIWWMVVLISAISFAGFISIKWAGARRGILLTAFFGGFASSTAIALSFARFGKESPGIARLLAAGVGMSSTMMFARMLVVVFAVSRDMALALLPVVAAVVLSGAIGVVLLWRGQRDHAGSAPVLDNGFSLGVPIRFGLLLAGVMVLSRGATEWLGDEGLYVVAAAAGVTDVDTITLSVAGDVKTGLAINVAVAAALIAAAVNTVVKGVIVAGVGGLHMGRLVALPFGLMLASGALTYVLF